MKMLVVSVISLISSFPLLGGASPADRQLLITAKQRANLSHDQTGPFQLDVDFVAQINTPVKGHLTLKWQAKDRWWREIIANDFGQIDIRNGDSLYTTRNLNFTPRRIEELISLLQFGEGSEKLTAKKPRQSARDGIEILCFSVEGEDKGRTDEVCLNSASHDILSDEWRTFPDELRIEQYADYFDFGEHRYPRSLELRVNSNSRITANVKSLRTAAFDQTLFVASKRAIVRRQCDDMKFAKAINAPNPEYPTSAREKKLRGDTTVAMTVLTDGSVTDIRLIGSTAQSMDDATLQTLKKWKFKPAMCGADPIVSDFDVVVSFRLH